MEKKTIEQIKDEVAIDHGWRNYDDINYAYRNGIISQYSFDDFFDDVAKLYSTQQVESAVKLTLQMAKDKGYVKLENNSSCVSSESITSLQQQVLREINK